MALRGLEDGPDVLGEADAIAVKEGTPGKAMGDDDLNVRVALHPADEYSKLIHVFFKEGGAVGARACEALADHGEEDGYA